MTDMRIIKKAVDVFLEALFPSGIYCISCGSLITPDRTYSLCDRCIRQLHWITGRTCSICGKALQDTYRGSICYSCLTRSHDFDRGYSCLTYGMHERELIFGLKYNGRGYLGRIFGDMIYDRISLENLSADVIIPVPVHRSRERRRGYNQAGIIADSLSEHAGIPADSRSLIRVRETQRLRGLDPLEREDVLEGAFAVRPDRRGRVEGRRIFLVDDIMTTGATADACSRVLRDAGASQVIFLSLASGSNRRPADLDKPDGDAGISPVHM